MLGAGHETVKWKEKRNRLARARTHQRGTLL